MIHTWQTCAAVFLPAALPREGRVAFWAPDGGELPTGATDLPPGEEAEGHRGVGDEAEKGPRGAGAEAQGPRGAGTPVGISAGTPAGTPDGAGGGDAGARVGELTVVRRHGAGVRSRRVPAVILGVAEALPHLVAARHHPAAHPATACWGAAALHA
ncbi:hypothetical protein J7E93_33400, partial [Streptomyces sp. ISL-36]|nr:hypothetical protein [Streptomyces sp. ISL-36]